VAALTGDHVMILADHDEQGEKLAAAAQKALAPVAASTRIVPATHLWKHLPGQPKPEPHADVWNWVVEHKGDPEKLLDLTACHSTPNSIFVAPASIALIVVSRTHWNLVPSR
jgi:hypothetical protein